MSGKKGMKHYSREVKLDRRLLNTFLELVMAIIMHRHRNHGLLLSELEGYLLGQNMAGRDEMDQ